MTNNEVTRFMRNYEELQSWTESNDPERNRFKLDGSSLEATNFHPVAEAAAAATQNNFITIFGRIRPSDEFRTEKCLKIELQVPKLYPYEPPIVFVRSKVSHPNIDHLKRLCTSSLDLDRNWKGDRLSDVIKTVMRIFDAPDEGHAIDVQMTNLYVRDRSQYNAKLTQMIEENGESWPV